MKFPTLVYGDVSCNSLGVLVVVYGFWWLFDLVVVAFSLVVWVVVMFIFCNSIRFLVVLCGFWWLFKLVVETSGLAIWVLVIFLIICMEFWLFCVGFVVVQIGGFV